MLDLAQHQSRVLGSEGDAVANGVLNLFIAAWHWNVVQITVRIRIFQIDSGGKRFVLHGNQGCSHTGGATRTLRMSNLRFQRRHWHLVGVVAESQLERTGLNAVVELGRCAVEVYVVDILG